MDLQIATRLFLALLGWSLLLQTAEFFRLLTLDRVGSWPIPREEVPSRPVWVRSVLDHVVQGPGYVALLTLRLGMALALLSGWVSVGLAVALFISSVLLLFRWRGAFNGGSDFMTLVSVTGLLIAQLTGHFTRRWVGVRACGT